MTSRFVHSTESAIDYVLKPFSAARFTRALGRAVDRLRADRNVGAVAHAVAERIVQIPESRARVKPLRRFVARTGNKVYFVRAQDVDWIDVTDNYLRLHTSGRTHLIRGTIADITLRLDPEQFVRVNRGAIVRVDTIATIEAIAPATYRLTLNDGTRVSSSRTYADFVRALMNP
jgi:two-component system LytT family response regulator